MLDDPENGNRGLVAAAALSGVKKLQRSLFVDSAEHAVLILGLAEESEPTVIYLNSQV